MPPSVILHYWRKHINHVIRQVSQWEAVKRSTEFGTQNGCLVAQKGASNGSTKYDQDILGKNKFKIKSSTEVTLLGIKIDKKLKSYTEGQLCKGLL